MILKKLIGTRSFYKKVFIVTVPILIQNIITNFVSLLDNVMVGQVGTEEMTGVAVVNQLAFVFNLCIFGAISGAGIFTAQYFGKGDNEGVKNTLRAKLLMAMIITAAAMAVLWFNGENLIKLFLHEGKDNIDIVATLEYGKLYMKIMLIGFPAFALVQAYADTLRSTGETVLPMKASVIAVIVNMFFNYMLIFGKFGAPQMGVAGAAIATVLARYTECAIIVLWTHIKHSKNSFADGLYKTLKIPIPLIKKILITGIPIMLNETLWAAGMTGMLQAYSVRGVEAVSALNISSTVSNLFFCSFFAFGNSISIIIGHLLGSGKLEEAKDENRKLIFCAVIVCLVVGTVMALVAPLVPKIYNTSDMVKGLASSFLIISALLMPVNGFVHSAYFTLRTGGKTIITFLFDSVFVWCVSIPVSYLLSRKTNMPIVTLYACVQSLEIIKCIIGFMLVKSGIWINNLVNTEK